MMTTSNDPGVRGASGVLMRVVYLGLAVLGTVMPYAFLITHFRTEGPGPEAFVWAPVVSRTREGAPIHEGAPLTQNQTHASAGTLSLGVASSQRPFQRASTAG